MYCPNCEVNYPDEVKECVNCASDLLAGIICKDCGTRNAPGSGVCNLCGTVFRKEKALTAALGVTRPKSSLELSGLSKICRHGHINEMGNIFCSECGCSLVHIDDSKIEAKSGRRGLFAALLGILSGKVC